MTSTDPGPVRPAPAAARAEQAPRARRAVPASASAPAAAREAGSAPRLTRATQRRVLAGVCQGLAAHLGVEVLWIRIAFVVLTVAGGAGAAMYAAFWVFAPLGVDAVDSDEEPEAGRETGYLIALAAVGAGGLLLLDRIGIGLPARLTWPLAVVGFGVVILWRQADDAQRSRWRRATRTTRGASAARAVVGAAFVVGGLAVYLAGRGSTSAAGQVVVALVVVTVGLAMISGPWWVRMARDLSAERAARIREQERAELAAHVHDSVLHTLTLIQRHVEDPREVARLARAQERELRTWLYRPVADPETTLAAALERTAADVEDAHGVAVDVVVVGDAALDEGLRAMLQAAREALVNAAKYADGAPVSLYAEAEPDTVTIFVRDRGPGFDLAAVPADRLGVRQSILGRMARHGGTAVVRTAPGEGTEVQLGMPVDPRGSTP